MRTSHRGPVLTTSFEMKRRKGKSFVVVRATQRTKGLFNKRTFGSVLKRLKLALCLELCYLPLILFELLAKLEQRALLLLPLLKGVKVL